jgi:deferrochelatase/peroxidase EfeB
MGTKDEKDASLLGRKVSRRSALTLAGAFGAGMALGGGGALSARELATGDQTEAFYGEHQAGISTPQQDRLHFASLDLTVSKAAEVRDLMRAWSEAAAKMCAGAPVGGEKDDAFVPPEDTGEAQDLTAGRLTITFGFGPTVFEKDGVDRFGFAPRKPAALQEIPDLPGDNLDPDLSGGDLCVQACADDPHVAFHAVRNLARIGRGAAVIRWSQLGFGRTSSTSSAQKTPRNLMGFKDGTNNIRAEDEEAMNRYVWVREGPNWMRGGTYLVARRIRMLIEIWDRSPLLEQEQTIGRHRASGAPLGKEDEYDGVDLKAKGPDGLPMIPVDSHIRLARKDPNERILRRGYSFTDGMDSKTGQLDAGLFFISFQQDPRKQFVPLQRRLGQMDRLTEYIQHTSSAVFACPPGVQSGGFVGGALFG